MRASSDSNSPAMKGGIDRPYAAEKPRESGLRAIQDYLASGVPSFTRCPSRVPGESVSDAACLPNQPARGLPTTALINAAHPSNLGQHAQVSAALSQELTQLEALLHQCMRQALNRGHCTVPVSVALLHIQRRLG